MPLPALLAPLAGALAVLAWRIRETQRPVTRRSIVIPPLGMSTGLFMFLVPDFRLPWSWAIGAFLAGALLLSIPLVHTSRMTRAGETIVLRRSRAFLVILLGLAALRLLFRDYVGQVLPPKQTAGVFFLLAFGMIVRWRVWMLGEYARLAAAPAFEEGAVPAE